MQPIPTHQPRHTAALAIPTPKALPLAASASTYVTIKQAADLRPAFTPAAFRDIKFKAYDRKNSRGDIIKGNGTGPAGVWVQIGVKVLVDLDAFDRWIASHRAGAAK